MSDPLLQRSVTLIPPGDVTTVPTWVACREIEPFREATDDFVQALEASGPIEARFRDFHGARARARQALKDEADLLPFLDNVAAALLLHFLDVVRQLILREGAWRKVGDRLQAMQNLRERVANMSPWDTKLQARANRMIEQSQLRLHTQHGRQP